MIKITVSTASKRYVRSSVGVEADSQIHLSQAIEVDEREDVEKARMTLLFKLEKKILLGMYLKGFLTKRNYDAELDGLNSRFQEIRDKNYEGIAEKV